MGPTVPQPLAFRFTLPEEDRQEEVNPNEFRLFSTLKLDFMGNGYLLPAGKQGRA